MTSFTLESPCEALTVGKLTFRFQNGNGALAPLTRYSGPRTRLGRSALVSEKLCVFNQVLGDSPGWNFEYLLDLGA